MNINKLLTSGLALLATAFTASAATIPYSSAMTTAEGWTSINNVRRGPAFFDDNGNSNHPDYPEGWTTGITKNYDSDYDTNCWRISPAVSVTAGTTYTVSIWAASRGTDDEAFDVTVGSGDSASDQTVKIISEPNYEHPGSYQQLTATWTPDTSGDVYFGVHCYSEAFHYDLFLTGFEVTDGQGGGGTEPDPGTDPEPEPEPAPGIALPYSFDCATANPLENGWTCAAGPEASTTEGWAYSEWGKYIQFDKASNAKEDNYLISPAISFPAEGYYVIKSRIMADSKVEVLRMADPANLTDASLVATYENTGLPDADEYREANLFVPAAGVYHIAYRACADSGSFMGNRLYSMEISDIADGVDAIDASSNAAPEYYNLQGIRVADPAPGIYIRRQAGRTSRIILK